MNRAGFSNQINILVWSLWRVHLTISAVDTGRGILQLQRRAPGKVHETKRAAVLFMSVENIPSFFFFCFTSNALQMHKRELITMKTRIKCTVERHRDADGNCPFYAC